MVLETIYVRYRNAGHTGFQHAEYAVVRIVLRACLNGSADIFHESIVDQRAFYIQEIRYIDLAEYLPHIIVVCSQISGYDGEVPVSQPLFPNHACDALGGVLYLSERIAGCEDGYVERTGALSA